MLYIGGGGGDGDTETEYSVSRRTLHRIHSIKVTGAEYVIELNGTLCHTPPARIIRAYTNTPSCVDDARKRNKLIKMLEAPCKAYFFHSAGFSRFTYVLFFYFLCFFTTEIVNMGTIDDREGLNF